MSRDAGSLALIDLSTAHHYIPVDVDGMRSLLDSSNDDLRSSLRILVYLVIYDSGKVSLEHLLLSWYPPREVMNENPVSLPTLSLSSDRARASWTCSNNFWCYAAVKGLVTSCLFLASLMVSRGVSNTRANTHTPSRHLKHSQHTNYMDGRAEPFHYRCRARREQVKRVSTRLPEKWLKPRPASGLDWPICSKFSRQRDRSNADETRCYM